MLSMVDFFKNGVWSSLVEVYVQTLAEIDHPVARMVAEYRQIEKLLQNLDSYCSEKEVRRLPGLGHPVSL